MSNKLFRADQLEMNVGLSDDGPHQYANNKAGKYSFRKKVMGMSIINVLICLLLVALSIFMTFFADSDFLYGIDTNKVYIKCKDPKLSYPLVPREDQTFNNRLMIILMILMVPYIAVFEFFKKKYKSITIYLKHCIECQFLFFVGFFTSFLIAMLVKAAILSPRPNYLKACQPDKELNCTAGEFYTGYKCLGTTANIFLQSFPSGHTTSAWATAFYVIYTSLKLPSRSWLGVKLMLTTAALSYAILVSYTRITDHYHHTEDVIVGGIIGIIPMYIILMSYKHN